MAYFPARDQSPAHVCREAVGRAKVFVLIAGNPLRLPRPRPPRAAYAELEPQTVTALGLRLVFMLGEETDGPAALFPESEHKFRQQAFRTRLLESGTTAVG